MLKDTVAKFRGRALDEIIATRVTASKVTLLKMMRIGRIPFKTGRERTVVRPAALNARTGRVRESELRARSGLLTGFEFENSAYRSFRTEPRFGSKAPTIQMMAFGQLWMARQ